MDDDEDMLEIGGIILKKAGYAYLPASSAETGLEILLAKNPSTARSLPDIAALNPTWGNSS